jgi:hypothetical protein
MMEEEAQEFHREIKQGFELLRVKPLCLRSRS